MKTTTQAWPNLLIEGHWKQTTPKHHWPPRYKRTKNRRELITKKRVIERQELYISTKDNRWHLKFWNPGIAEECCDTAFESLNDALRFADQ